MSGGLVDVMIIGGGLGGMTAALILARAKRKVVLIDSGLPEAGGALGGFTSFSGAKFSLLPAGKGLIPVAGSVEKLREAMGEVFEFCGLERQLAFEEAGTLEDSPLAVHAAIRTYTSVVLSPDEIRTLVGRTSAHVKNRVKVVDAKVFELVKSGNAWVAEGLGGHIAHASTVLFAGGRTGGSLLRRAGATPQEGKGLDVGVRLEFMDRNALRKLRERGPDAKILFGQTRTFCLNYPGRIYRYPFSTISIPGGVVETGGCARANFGILTRIAGKATALDATLAALATIPPKAYEDAPVVRGAPFQDKATMLVSAYGKSAADQLRALAETLGQEGLVDWQSDHRVHFPLLDWHWDVFALGPTHRTSLPGLYVAGDTAGHARGLLQAGISGWLAAHELLNEAS